MDWLWQLCFSELPAEQYFGPILTAARARHEGEVELAPRFLGGDRLEIEAMSAGFQGLRLTTDRLDLFAALLRGMVAGHRVAWESLGLDTTPGRIVLTGGGAKLVRSLIPDYDSAPVELLEQAALRGVAHLFD